MSPTMDRSDCGQVAGCPSSVADQSMASMASSRERSPANMVSAVFMHQLEHSVPLKRLPERHYQLTKTNRGLQLLLNGDAGFPRRAAGAHGAAPQARSGAPTSRSRVNES